MAKIKPFMAVRPDEKVAEKVAALPYDVYNRQEAKEAVKDNPLSFLRIDRAETQLPDSIDTYAPEVYAKAKEIFESFASDGTFITDNDRCYYIYQLAMDGRKQAGIVACASIDDYINNVIKKHENTREEKEQDRIRHIDTLSAQTGPIFLAYRSQTCINNIVARIISEDRPLYNFTSDDGIGHAVWKVSDECDITTIENSFAAISDIYIADGHHRAASAVKAGLKRREACPGYNGTEEFNYFLSVLFPDESLMIMDYNRTIRDLNGLSREEFMEKVKENFGIKELSGAVHPSKKGEVAMYLDKKWYMLSAKEELFQDKDAVASLDVSILQDYLLHQCLA